MTFDKSFSEAGSLDDDIDEFGFFDEDGLFDAGGGVFLNFLVGKGEVEDFLLVVEVAYIGGEGGAEFAVDLDDNGDSVGSEIFVIPSGPFVGGVEVLQHFAGEVWSEGF